jgi:hypothetical protein
VVLASTDNTGTNVPTSGELFTLNTSNFVTTAVGAGNTTDGTFYLEAFTSGSGETLDISYSYNTAPERGHACSCSPADCRC